jgi:hypothetical protein
MTRALERLSRLRQSLARLREEATQLLEVFLGRDPLVRGTVYELRRKCGKPSCGCATAGPLHAVTVLSVSEEGRTHLRAIPQDQITELRTLTARYRRFRRARARLVKVHRTMVAVIDQLAAARRRER